MNNNRKGLPLYKAVLTASSSGLSPQEIASIVRDAAIESGIVPAGGLWVTWLDKAAATSGEALV